MDKAGSDAEPQHLVVMQEALRRVDAATVSAWRTGWIGIVYGLPTHGFAELDIDVGKGAAATFWWLGSDGDVYESLRLRYSAARARIDFLVKADDFEPWNREESAVVPVNQRALMRRLCSAGPTTPDELFTRMATEYADSFEVLTSAAAETDLYWDHHYKPGPDASDLWRPVQIGPGTSPFRIRTRSEHE